jgi:hypothetical protein
MPEHSHNEQAQIERAKRLRSHIERLKRGEPESLPPQKGKSIKEQIAERTEEHK